MKSDYRHKNELFDRKVFVGGLSYTTEDDVLIRHFEESFGPVESATIMRDRSTNTSRGFGFVVFHDQASALACIKASPVRCDGANVEVRKAELKRKESRRGPCKVFVGGLDPQTSEAELQAYLNKFGATEDVEIIRERGGNKSRGFGFAMFEHAEDAHLCVGRHPDMGRSCEVKLAVPRVREDCLYHQDYIPQYEYHHPPYAGNVYRPPRYGTPPPYISTFNPPYKQRHFGFRNPKFYNNATSRDIPSQESYPYDLRPNYRNGPYGYGGYRR